MPACFQLIRVSVEILKSDPSDSKACSDFNILTGSLLVTIISEDAYMNSVKGDLKRHKAAFFLF